jgi:hypothetical protein
MRTHSLQRAAAIAALSVLAGCGGDDSSQTSSMPSGGGATANTGASGGTALAAGGSTAPNGAGGGVVGAGGGGVAAGGASVGGFSSIGGTSGSAASGGGSSGAPAGGAAGAGPHIPSVTSVDAAGPYTVTVDQNAGASSWVFRPTELGKDGVKHPIFVWGTGATSVPSQYTDHLTRIASHGIVTISPNSASVNATLLKASLDWIVAQNDAQGSVYYQKLDTTKIAMGGHSLGSIGTFDEEATDTRLVTTIHIAGGSFDGMGSSKVKTITAYICGGSGDIAQPNCEKDFGNATQPTFYSVLDGIDHIGAARAALPGMVAWLRWHLLGETDRKAMFTGPDGDFFKGIWKSQTKNW